MQSKLFVYPAKKTVEIKQPLRANIVLDSLLLTADTTRNFLSYSPNVSVDIFDSFRSVSVQNLREKKPRYSLNMTNKAILKVFNTIPNLKRNQRTKKKN